MKRQIGLMAANWLKKPENQEKIKRKAQQFWDQFQQARRSDDNQADNDTTASGQRGTHDSESTDRKKQPAPSNSSR